MYNETIKIRKKIARKLENVLDPELNISIVDLGLLYNIEIKEKTAIITITLTTIGCPLFETIQKDIEKNVKQLSEIESVTTNVVFDPPWSLSMVSPQALAELGME
jgi:metal-sulfur cluster biosynthetic enzyme